MKYCNPEMLLESVLFPGQATYITTPITTGPRLEQLKRSLPRGWREPSLLREEVIKPNIAHAIEVELALRELWGAHSVIIINPARFYQDSWSQEDYIELWLHVIRKYVSRVVLCTGWEESAGSMKEYGLAKRLNILCLTEQEALGDDWKKEGGSHEHTKE